MKLDDPRFLRVTGPVWEDNAQGVRDPGQLCRELCSGCHHQREKVGEFTFGTF